MCQNPTTRKFIITCDAIFIELDFNLNRSILLNKSISDVKDQVDKSSNDIILSQISIVHSQNRIHSSDISDYSQLPESVGGSSLELDAGTTESSTTEDSLQDEDAGLVVSE